MSPAGTTIGVRLSGEILKRLDSYVERLAQGTGLDVTRAAAARRLILLGLGHVENPGTKKRKR